MRFSTPQISFNLSIATENVSGLEKKNAFNVALQIGYGGTQVLRRPNRTDVSGQARSEKRAKKYTALAERILPA